METTTVAVERKVLSEFLELYQRQKAALVRIEQELTKLKEGVLDECTEISCAIHKLSQIFDNDVALLGIRRLMDSSAVHMFPVGLPSVPAQSTTTTTTTNSKKKRLTPDMD